MREKPVSPERIEKYKAFLVSVYDFAKAGNDSISLWSFAKSHNVSSGTPKALYQMGIIKKDETIKIKWHWLVERPSRELALRVLDYLLHKNKKTIHVPIPDFAGISQSLQTIAERLTHISVQNERLLKTAKNGLKLDEGEADLFRVDDQELYIAGQVANGIYSTYSLEYAKQPDNMNFINSAICDITKDLINKLRNKE